MLNDLSRDLRYGVRILARARSFALVSILTLGLGIGAATAVFTAVDGVLLRPLPYPDAERIVRLFQVDRNGRRNNTVSEPNFEDWKAGTRSFQAMAEMASGPSAVSIGTEASTMVTSMVSREFFDVMAVSPSRGRRFSTDEQKVGGPAAAIISDRLWRTRLAGGPLETLTVRIDSTVHQVVGIMPPGFDYPGGSDVWLARERNPPQTSRTAHNFQVVARVAPDVTVAAAHAELSALSRALQPRYGDGTWMFDAAAVPLREQLTVSSRPVLMLLFGAAVLLLVIACLNVSNLHLARASARQRELALRLAVGANRGRLVRQLLAEALVLSALAAIVGTAIAALGVRTLSTLQPANVPRIADIGIDVRALGFALAVTVATALLLSLFTSLRVSPERLRAALTDGQRSMSGGGSERVRQLLVVAQVALTIVLLVGASLLARSFLRVLAVDPGYRTDNAVVLDLVGSAPRNPDARLKRAQQQHEILEEVGRLPGVERTGLISALPLGGGNFVNGRFLEMTRPDEIQSFEDVAKLGDEARVRAGQAAYRIASRGYFEAMDIPLIRGRLFDESDGPDAPHVALISESLARAKWPQQDPLGRFVQFGNMDGDLRGFRIIGIVGDVRELSPETVPGPIFYGHYRQRLASRPSVVVRAPASQQLIASAREIVRRIDPETPVQVRTIEQALDRVLAGRRFSLMLIGVFGVSALVLATLGVYGLMSYLVAQRTREIGIRLALGADAGDVLRLIVGRAVTLAIAGIVAGALSALAVARLLDGMLFGITASDPLAFAGVIALTLSAALAASYAPARRAVRLAPVAALRAE